MAARLGRLWESTKDQTPRPTRKPIHNMPIDAQAMKSCSMNIRRCWPSPVSNCKKADPRATAPLTAPSRG